MKRLLMTSIAIGALVVWASFGVRAQQGGASELPDKVWKRGLAIAPVSLNMGTRDKRLVGAGSYLVNTMCVDCHTNPTFAAGGDPFSGQPEKVNAANYLAGGAQFGPFTSANITPDSKGLPAGLTLDQFKQLMRTGFDADRHPQFGPFLQVMPWPAIGKLTDDDLNSIYAYLSSVPHAEPAH